MRGAKAAMTLTEHDYGQRAPVGRDAAFAPAHRRCLFAE